MPPLRRIAIVIHHGRPAAVAAAEAVRQWGRRHGVDVSEADVWRGPGGPPDPAASAGLDATDLVVTAGGDGTFLRGARLAAGAGVPVLGVNAGRVGFLTDVDPDRIRPALDAVAAGRVEIEERSTLTMCANRPPRVPADIADLLRYGRGPCLPPAPRQPAAADEARGGVPLDVIAVNDIVFEKLARDRQVSVGLYLNEQLFASYSADALIVASPTGSTAYSFATGGPVLSPRLGGMVFTPVAPHMVFNRSLVLAGDEQVAVLVLDRSGPVAVSVDGQLRGVIEPGDWVAVYTAPAPVRLVRLHRDGFYSRLRQRFALADAPAASADGDAPARYRPPAGATRLVQVD